MQTMPNIDDISIGLIAAVARRGNQAMGTDLPASDGGNPSLAGGGPALFGQASGGIIGHERSIPWRLPADLAHFRKLTLDKTVIMGRCTYESIGRPLDRRTNIVISSRPGYKAQGCITASSFDEALEKAALKTCVDLDYTSAAKNDGQPNILIIGGESIYGQALSLFERFRLYLYLTLVDIVDVPGDTFFPKFDTDAWRQTKYREQKADERNPHDMHFFDLIEQSNPHIPI
ncbi:dihydrofolate reductase [Thioalkalivibrio sp. HK1]|uniref:dihydrofolate reductase n=1 Tax=Thioalkalivibrio sp. HK1 TaxID=1469245 RepID=UPI0018CC433F|nr:dihydrofolate reductase [Thioalkalivibrio sp. HK1]